MALLQRRIAVWINEWLKRGSTCLFFIATGSKALALPKRACLICFANPRFLGFSAIRNQKQLATPTCRCVNASYYFAQ